MKRLVANKSELCTLCKANAKLRKNMIKHVPDEVIKAIADIAHNVLQSNVKISGKTHDLLKPYKNTLRKVSDPQLRTSSKRKLLVQRGGSVIPLLIGTVLSILNSL